MLLDAGSHFCCMLDHFTCIHTVTRRIHLWSLLRSWQLTLVVVYMAICYQKKTDSSLVEDVGDHLVLEANLGIIFLARI